MHHARALACALALLVLLFGRLSTARAEGGQPEAKQDPRGGEEVGKDPGKNPAPLQKYSSTAPNFNTSDYIFACATNHQRLM
jgi:hypothetical protein